MSAGLAPHDEPNTGSSRAAQRRRRADLGFHPRRLRAALARGGGSGSRTGSGRIFPRIAFKV
jgi:hypothetical protein